MCMYSVYVYMCVYECTILTPSPVHLLSPPCRGVALGIALQQRGISYTLFEKDKSFDSRRQGYGLTMQVRIRVDMGCVCVHVCMCIDRATVSMCR